METQTELKPIMPYHLEHYRELLLRFVQQHGDKRITLKGLHALRRLTAQQLTSDQGHSLLIATVGKRLIGLSLVLSYGKDTAIIVVHPRYRGHQLGSRFIKNHLKVLGAYACSVALDNASSLKMCFRAGLFAIDLFTGPTGKPTLRFASSVVKPIQSR